MYYRPPGRYQSQMSLAEEEQEPPTKKQKNAVLPIPPLLPKPPSCSDQKSGSPASLRNQQAKPPSCSDQSSGSTANIFNQRAKSPSSSGQSSGSILINQQRVSGVQQGGQRGKNRTEMNYLFDFKSQLPYNVQACIVFWNVDK